MRCGEILGMVNSGGVLSLARNKDIKARVKVWVEMTQLVPELDIKEYEQSKHDYSLFIKAKGESFTAALVYVDDVLITCNSSFDIQHLKQALDDKFTIKDLRLAKLTIAKPNSSPLPTNLKLSLEKGVPLSDHDVLEASIHLLKYLKGSSSKGLFYPIQPHLKVTGFSDADWASCLMTRKSLIGYCIFLGHSLVS
ncbi:retrovirus-related pol polyprotein from transposon TNT 1-94 [Tanacetum coccineum]